MLKQVIILQFLEKYQTLKLQFLLANGTIKSTVKNKKVQIYDVDNMEWFDEQGTIVEKDHKKKNNIIVKIDKEKKSIPYNLLRLVPETTKMEELKEQHQYVAQNII